MRKFVLTISCTITMLYGMCQANGKAIITKSENDLVPEGIAIDKNGNIYISSINRHKIVIIDKEGRHKDFITEDQDGFLEGLGMKPDEKETGCGHFLLKERANSLAVLYMHLI